jgi:hypothetical protein
MIRSIKSNNEHGFDCCEFFSLAAPHRWKTIQDFMYDRNGTVSFALPVSVDARFCVGTCGPPPDEHLMFREDCGIDLDPYVPEMTPSERRAANYWQDLSFQVIKRTAKIESEREYDAQIRRKQKSKITRERRAATEEYRHALYVQNQRARRDESRAADAQVRLDQEARDRRLEEEAVQEQARLAEKELAEFLAHQPIVELYIATMLVIQRPPPGCLCHGGGVTTFERFGRRFPWPCACIGGRDPSCVAQWMKRSHELI